MVTVPMALRLKEYGLEWKPKLHDFFAIPNTTLEGRLFVVSDMMIDIQRLYGRQMITFNGAVEWSLDYITIAEALWMPSETQLREMVQRELEKSGPATISLDAAGHDYACSITYRDNSLAFEANSASNAYARALLYLLKESNGE